jgi:predicted methyltransferase
MIMSDFFEKFQDMVNLEENIEGIREILLAIYRNGTISVKGISKITTLPIPIVSKIVNILIEKKILTRTNMGVLFWEPAMQFVEEHFGFYGYGVQECPECKGRPNHISPRVDAFFEYLNPIFEQRPSVETRFDQSKNTVETAIQRSLYLYRLGALEGKHVLFIGDDDFTSVAIAMLYLLFFPEEPKLIPKSITVIDIDTRILEMIQNIYKTKNFPVECITYNLKDPIPKELLDRFDTIITDPPYSINGLKLFLARAINMMKISGKYSVGKDIFLSYAHRSSERMLEIQRIINSLGLSIMEMIPKFNRYEGSEVLGNQTQMFHLKTTSLTKTIMDPTSSFTDDLYTGETHPYIRKYKCKECGHEIDVGSDREFETIELLKGNKCPNCKESKTFELLSRNIESIDE